MTSVPPRPAPRTLRLAPPLGLAALLILLFWKVVFRGEVFYERDIHLIFLGQAETFVRAVRSGSWPLWDPYPGFGQPMLANPDAQVLYPLTWLNLILSPATYYVFFVFAHLLFSALGLRALARRLDVSERGAFVAAALWMLSGPFLSLVNLWHHFASAAWIPWVLLAADRALATGRRQDTLLWAGAMTAQILAGSADMVAMTSLLMLAQLVICALRRGEGRLPLARLGAATAGAGALAVALSAGLWLPTLEAAYRSERWHLPPGTRTTWSLHPFLLPQTFVPLPLHELPLDPRWRETLFDSREPFLMSIYLGALTVALAAGAWIGPRRRGRGLFTATALLAILAALGKHTPFYDLLTTVAVPLRLIRYPYKAMVFAAFALALIAGMGYDAWQARRPTDIRRWRIGAAALLLGLAVGAGTVALVGWFGAPAVGRRLFYPDTAPATATALLAPLAARVAVTGIGCLIAAGFAASRRAGGRAAAVVAGLAVLDLGAAHASLNRTVPRKILTYRPATLDYVDQRDLSRLYVFEYFGGIGKSEGHLKHLSMDEQAELRSRWPFPYAEIIAHRSYLLPPVGEIWGLYGSYDMDMRRLYPLPQARVAQLLRSIEETPGHLRLLRIGAVSRVIAYHTEGLEELVPLATLPGLRAEPVRVYAVPHPVPRAYVVSGTRIADGHDALLALLDPGFDASREVVLADGVASRADPAFAGTARIVELATDRVRFEVDLSSPGYAVLVDSYDPGWHATVDGVAAEVLRANVAFRAVPVAAGRHVVELLYRPRSVRIGMAIMGTAFLLTVIGALSSRRGAAR